MDVVEEIGIGCPNCGEEFFIEVETTTAELVVVEDCAVCCRPATVRVRCEPGAVLSVDISAD
ncbi:MAG: CPXCG motif-containing cysteine-rich protein [Chthoniobacterales bacterium]